MVRCRLCAYPNKIKAYFMYVLFGNDSYIYSRAMVAGRFAIATGSCDPVGDSAPAFFCGAGRGLAFIVPESTRRFGTRRTKPSIIKDLTIN